MRLHAAALCLFILVGLAHTASGRAPTVKGKVTDAQTSLGIDGLDLDVYDTSGNSVTIPDGKAGPDGSYTITLPGPGNYIIRADASVSDGYADEYYNEVFFPSLATALTLADSQDLTGINFTLVRGVTLSGKIVSGGVPLAGIDVGVYVQGPTSRESLSGYSRTTDASGNFTVGVLPPGDYFIRAKPDPTAGQFYIGEFFGGATSLSQAAPLTVGTSNITGVNFDLAAGATITGHVSGAGGAALADIDFDLYDTLGVEITSSAKTDASGNYTVGPVPVGSYVLRADPTLAQGYPRTYYPNADRFDASTPVAVVLGQATTGIDFVLSPAGSISGLISDALTLLPLGTGIGLDLYNLAGNKISAASTLFPDGTYSVGPVAPGQYRLSAGPEGTNDYALEFWDNKRAEDLADPITVTAGNVTSNINFPMDPIGSITGKIVDAGSLAPLVDIDLDLYDAQGNEISISAKTDSLGNFTVASLAAGTYILRADPTLAQEYPRTYYPNVYDSDLSTPITVVGGQVTANINFSLPRGGSINGLFTNAETTQPITGIGLDCYDLAGNRLSVGVKFAVDGTYQLGPVPPGSYHVLASPDSGAGYLNEYWDNKRDALTADAIVVTAGSAVQGINFPMDPVGSITGHVTGAGGAPLVDVDFDIYDTQGNEITISGAKSEADGSYALGPLAAGTYVVRVDPAAATGYPRTYYPTAPNFDVSTPITVSSGQVVAGIDFALAIGGTISGTITDAVTTLGITGVSADAYDAQGNQVSAANTTDVSGNYTIGPVAPGTYRMRARDDVGATYVPEFWNNKRTLAAADTFEVTAGNQTPGINFAMDGAGGIAGTVRDGLSQPIAGIRVDLYDAASGLKLDPDATTLADGTYLITPVGPGQYKLRCRPTLAQGFAAEYYNDKPNRTLADPVTVVDENGLSGIDFVLTPGGSISGTITAANGGAPLAGLDVSLYLLGGPDAIRLDGGATTDALGNYTIGPVAPGSYLVRVDPDITQPYPTLYYINSTSQSRATAVPLAALEAVTGINLALPDYPLSARIADLLLGRDDNPAGLDVNGDGVVDAADVVQAAITD